MKFEEKLGVSRQAISRWELGTTMPDVPNLLHISELFGVSTDYLLHDDYESDNDIPKVKETKELIEEKYAKQEKMSLITGILWICDFLAASRLMLSKVHFVKNFNMYYNIKNTYRII